MYHPSTGCWLLVTSLDEVAPVTPGILLICIENLRTLVEFEDTLCFHLADIYRGKFLSQHWLQLLAIILSPSQNTFNRQIHVIFENVTTVLEALSVVHDWSCTNLGDRPLRRTLWQARKAILDHLAPSQDNQSTLTGKLLTTHPKVKPNYLPWITSAETDILQARVTVVICCPADLLSYSAMARYVIREYGQDKIFKLRPAVGKAIHLAKSHDAPWNNSMFLLFTRASNKHPILHDVLHLCLLDLVQNSRKPKSPEFTFPSMILKGQSTYYQLGIRCCEIISFIQKSTECSTTGCMYRSHPSKCTLSGQSTN